MPMKLVDGVKFSIVCMFKIKLDNKAFLLQKLAILNQILGFKVMFKTTATLEMVYISQYQRTVC